MIGKQGLYGQDIAHLSQAEMPLVALSREGIERSVHFDLTKVLGSKEIRHEDFDITSDEWEFEWPGLAAAMEGSLAPFQAAAYTECRARYTFLYPHEAPQVHETLDLQRAARAMELLEGCGYPFPLRKLAQLLRVFDSTGRPWELLEQFFPPVVLYFLTEASPPASTMWPNDRQAFEAAVAHFAVASALAQTVIMADLLVLLEVDAPDDILADWWELPAVVLKKADAKLRELLLGQLLQA